MYYPPGYHIKNMIGNYGQLLFFYVYTSNKQQATPSLLVGEFRLKRETTRSGANKSVVKFSQKTNHYYPLQWIVRLGISQFELQIELQQSDSDLTHRSCNALAGTSLERSHIAV